MTIPFQDGILRFPSIGTNSEDHFPKDAFENLYKVEANSFWFEVRNIIIGKTLQDYLPVRSRLIEVGCGTGFVSRYLKEIGYHVECGDLHLEGLQYCKERDAGEAYYQFNLQDPIFSEEYDAYCAFDVLEHLDDDERALDNMYVGLNLDSRPLITRLADLPPGHNTAGFVHPVPHPPEVLFPGIQNIQ